MTPTPLEQAIAVMEDQSVDPRAIAVFADYHQQLSSGVTGTIPEDSIDPLGRITELGDYVAGDDERRVALSGTAVIKLNGGLGTSMGLSGPKSELTVRDGLTFLDIIAEQVLALRRRFDVEVPLILMDSFRTRDVSVPALRAMPGVAVDGIPLDFLQNVEPKVRADDLTPVSWPADPELEWCPPGHGDVYVALQGSGILDTLRERGFRYLFLSNADNLGATCDPDVAAWMMAHGLPFVIEVSDRTVNDRKGGHLAVRRSDGRLVLREKSMVEPDDEHWFQDIARHRYFNTNNLWVDLHALDEMLARRGGRLGLPIIVNHKTVDPSDPGSTPVIQIESAMGAAIEVFEGSEALLVPRRRFRPVKTTNELLLIRSDLYRLTDDFTLVSTTDGPEPRIDLDENYWLVPDFEKRFPHGAPSLRECTSLVVSGDITFGADVTCVGDVELRADEPMTIPDGTRLEG